MEASLFRLHRQAGSKSAVAVRLAWALAVAVAVETAGILALLALNDAGEAESGRLFVDRTTVQLRLTPEPAPEEKSLDIEPPEAEEKIVLASADLVREQLEQPRPVERMKSNAAGDAPSEHSSSPSAAGGQGAAGGNAGRRPAAGQGAAFFGVPSQGARIVFVIDRSASMRSALATAKQELLQTLELLPVNSGYQVILYDLEPRLAVIDGRRGFLTATVANCGKIAEWLDGFRSEGGTDHVRALKTALKLSPSVIYFLTDADDLQPSQVRELTLLNQRGCQARIHCIELNAAASGDLNAPMQLLARENRGIYRCTDPDSWHSSSPRPR